MPCRMIDLQTLPATPWKNGGGSTRQLAIHPPLATLDNFAWRISCARVESASPFSAFPGIDRSLALLDGHGLRLRLDGTSQELRPAAGTLVFAGEAEVWAQPIDGPVHDLSLMSRRDAWRQRLWQLQLDGERALHNDAEVLLLLCTDGHLHVQGRATLRTGQALLLEDECGELRLRGTAAWLQVAQLYRRP